MPRLGLRALFLRSHHESHHPQHLHEPVSNHGRSLTAPPSPSYYPGRSSSVTSPSPSPSRQTFSATMMDENIALTESIITKWDPSTNLEARMTSLFRSDKREAGLLLRAVANLQRAMLFFSSDELAGDPAVRSRALVRAQALMQAAIRRLEVELDLLLSSSPDPLESISARPSSSSGNDESSDEEKISSDASDAVPAADDLRAISETMIAAGYGKEYVRIYKSRRKSIVDEGLYRLGFERLSSSHIQKLDWDILELKIKSWLHATGPAIQTLFSGERALAEHVFSGSDSILESCFADITRDAAIALLSFPDSIAKTKCSPEKLFRILDLYDTISTLLPSIESLFSFESTTVVLSQTLNTLQKLEDTANSLLADFETLIQKDAARSAVSGGGVHPLTRYVTNYIVFLGDYKLPLANIIANSNPAPQEPDPEETSLSSPMAKRISWLVFVLLCKLDGKAEAYKHAGQSYLFLANNLHYIVNKIGESELKEILGGQWLQRHSAKARHYMGNYERLVWATVAAAIPAAGVATAKEAGESMKAFNAAFEEASRNQGEWVVVDKTAREEVRASAVRMVVPAYRGFYWRCRELLGGGAASAVVRYSPEAVRNRIEELVSIPCSGPGSGSGPVSGSSSSSSASGSGLGSKLSFCWR